MRISSLLFALACFLSVSSHAQSVLWAKCSESRLNTGFSEGRRIDVDSGGNVYVIGNFYSTLTLSGDSISSDFQEWDVYLAKYSSSGNLLWIKNFGNNNAFYNYGGDVKVDKNGDIIIFCYFYYSASFYGQLFKGGVLAKIDPDGNLKWAKHQSEFGLLSFNYNSTLSGSSRLAIDSLNNIVVFASGDLQIGDYANFYLFKFNQNGNQMWQQLIGTFYQYPFGAGVFPGFGGITLDARDEIIITGLFVDYITIGGQLLSNHYPRPSVNPDIAQFYIAKFSSTGSFEWARQGDYSLLSWGFQVMTDPSNNIYFTGIVIDNSMIAGYPTNASGQNGFVAMMSPAGNVKWLKLFPQLNSGMWNTVYPYGIAGDPTGGLYVTGSFYNAISYQSYSNNQNQAYELFVMKLTLSGNFLGVWNSTTVDKDDFNYREIFQSVPDSLGNVYAVGTFDKSIHFENDSISSPDAPSLVLLKIGQFPFVYDMFVNGPEKLCAGMTVTLFTNKVSGASSYVWNLPAGVTPVSGSTTTSSNSITVNIGSILNEAAITVSTSGMGKNYQSPPYYLELENALIGTLTLTGPTEVCPKASNLSYQCSLAQNAIGYQWVLPTGIKGSSTDSLSNQRSVSINNQFTTGSITVTALGACNNLISNPINISLIPPLAQPKIAGPSLVCAIQKDTLWSTAPVDNANGYFWEHPLGINFDANTDGTTVLANISPSFVAGYLKVTPYGICGIGSLSDSLMIVGMQTPSAAAPLSGPKLLCLGDRNIKYEVSSIDNSIQYKWNIPSCFDSGGVLISNSNSIVVNVVNAEQGAITVQGINQCSQVGTPTLLIVQIDEPLPIPLISKGRCDLELSTNGSSEVQWYKDQALILQDTFKVIQIADSGIYKVTVKNYCGSVESQSVQVYPVLKDNVFFPNVITPNGDGKNECFVISKSLVNSSLLILNRWGDTVFKMDNYQNNWNGSNLDVGVYYYYLTNNCLDSPYRGWIQVIR